MYKTQAINELKRLKKRIGLANENGLKARIEFVKIVFLHGLKNAIIHYDLFDEHNLGERDFDTCFEMHDGDLVVHGLIEASLSDQTLATRLKQDLCEENYNYWLSRHKEVKEKQCDKNQFTLDLA